MGPAQDLEAGCPGFQSWRLYSGLSSDLGECRCQVSFFNRDTRACPCPGSSGRLGQGGRGAVTCDMCNVSMLVLGQEPAALQLLAGPVICLLHPAFLFALVHGSNGRGTRLANGVWEGEKGAATQASGLCGGPLRSHSAIISQEDSPSWAEEGKASSHQLSLPL